METRVQLKNLYLIAVIAIGLIGLGIGSTFAMFTASANIDNPIAFSSNLSSTNNLAETIEVVVPAGEDKNVDIVISNTSSGNLNYTAWYSSTSNDLFVGSISSNEAYGSVGIIPTATNFTLTVQLRNSGDTPITVTIGVSSSASDIVLASGMTQVPSSELRPQISSISAVFNQGNAIITTNDNIGSLRQYLTVTANYSDGTSEILSSSDYTLSGTLSEGTSTLTVTYKGKEDTFNVNVTDGLRVNLFDSMTAPNVNLYIRTYDMVISSGGNINYSSSYISVKPNTTYTITKSVSNSFRIGTTTDVPNYAVNVLQTEANHNGTTITITTDTNANYLFFTYLINNGEYDESVIRDSIVIVEENNAYTPISSNLKASAIVPLADIYNNGHGWTCTGLAYDENSDTFLVGDIGKTLPSHSGFASQIVRVSHDFSNVVEQIPLYTVFPNMSDVQGITIDTTDDSIWFCSTSENLIRHIDANGNNIGSFSVSGQPTGIAYSPSDDTFWILTYGNSNNIKHVNKTGSVLEQYTFSYNETLDQCFLDSTNGYLYITAGSNYSSNNNVYLFNTSTHEQSISYIVDSYAVEGIWIGSNEMIIVNDGYYHSAKDNVNQANFYTLRFND